MLADILEKLSPERRILSTLPRLMGHENPGSVLCLGKAAFSMARGAVALYPSIRGMAYGTAPCGEVPTGWQTLLGSHPLPSAGNLSNTEAVSDWVSLERNCLLVLISGGTSSLLVDPVPPWNLEEKVQLSSRLIRSGASITEINVVRMRVSRVKCGGLRHRCPAPSALTGIWSDVPRGYSELVGSAPTIHVAVALGAEAVIERYGISPHRRLPEGPTADRHPLSDRHFLLCDSARLQKEALGALSSLGLEAAALPLPEGTPAAEMAACFARAAEKVPRRRRAALIAVGEVSVEARGGGRGGRCSHLAALVSLAMREKRSWEFVAMATDGVDGSGDGGAAIGSGCLPSRGEIEDAVREFDTSSLWARHGLDIPGRPTGNNLRDIYLLVLGGEP